MVSTGLGWRIVPYETLPQQASSPFKKVRVRDETRARAVVRHLMNDECVALLGPPMSEKTHLLRDVAAALTDGGRFRPLHIDLWRTRSNDEEAFFTSLADLLASELGAAAPDPSQATDARAFQGYLNQCANTAVGSVALLIDHLQALPHDLVHSLLVALRAAYMEREADAPHGLVAVVTGGVNLVGLSAGPTSPFNIAKPVVSAPLTEEQSRALAEGTLSALGCSASENGMDRILKWGMGDRYLIPRLCADSSELVSLHRQHRVSSAIVERAAVALLQGAAPPPIRAAVRMAEEDPDTVLDVLHLLDHDSLPRAKSRQMPTRTGTDRLQLSGAVVLSDGCYAFVNETYRRGLRAHFTTDRVGHILRIAGRWSEAIAYLAPQRVQLARPQLLEAIVQSIYASDAADQAYALIADGLRLGFGLSGVAIYFALPAQARLDLVYPLQEGGPQVHVDLRGPGGVEAQTFHLGNYALRGTKDEARLVVALASPNRTLGVVTVERYVENRDPHELPDELPELLRFLQHAAGALENVITRAAYRTIGQAVLDAKAMQPTVERVLDTLAEALGCDYGALYLTDDNHRQLDMAAAVGKVITDEWQAQAHFPLSGRHPAVAALLEGRSLTARGGEATEDRALVDRFGLHRYVRVFLPLIAGGEPLGTLELGYGVGRVRLSDDHKRTLSTFAEQVAIAVHNMLLLRRTDEALARKLAELSVGREIQLSLLPKTTPVISGWQFSAMYQAARTVGGDFYDYLELPGAPARLGVIIADVADKGVPAALFMAVSRTIIRSVAFTGRGPASALTRANQLILADSQADLFLSAIYLVLETGTGRVSFSNAGHNRPLLYRAAARTLSELTQRGIILGAFDEITLQEDRLDLESGDVLVLYTDGVTDALNAEGEEFGEQRLFDVISASAGASSEEILWAITGAVAGFIGETEQADDVTCVVIKRD